MYITDFIHMQKPGPLSSFGLLGSATAHKAREAVWSVEGDTRCYWELWVQVIHALDHLLFLPPGLCHKLFPHKRTGLAAGFSIDVNLKTYEINEDISQGPIKLHTTKSY